MADIKNKNELKRRIEMFLDEFSNEEYKANEEFCKETMGMMRGFIGRACHLLDCEKRISENLKQQLKPYKDLEITAERVKDIDKAYTDLCAEFGEYKKLEEKGLLLKLPCKVGDKAYHVIKDHLANPPIYISEHEIQDVSAKAVYFADDWWMIEEMPEMNAFLSKEAAEQALKELSGRVNRNGNFTG